MTDLSLAADTNSGVSLTLPRVDLTGYALEMIVAARGISYTATLEDGLSLAVSGSGDTLESVVTWAYTQEQSNALPLGAVTVFDLYGTFDGTRSKLAAGTISVDGAGELSISAASASVPGIQGARGWSPLFAAVEVGTSIVFEVSDWTGGGGDKPSIGQYLGPGGLVDDIDDATLFASPADAVAAAESAAASATAFEAADAAATAAQLARADALTAAANTTANLDGGPVFLTEADLLAYAPDDTKPATLAVDNGTRLRGVYRRTDGAWPPTRESDTLPGVDTRLNAYQADVTGRLTSIADNGADLVTYDGSDYWPFLPDLAGGMAMGIDLSTGEAVGSAIDGIVTTARWDAAARQAVGADFEPFQIYTGDDIWPIIPDAANGVVLGYNLSTEDYFGSMVDWFVDNIGGSGSGAYDPRWSSTTTLSPVPYANRWLHTIVYGQSLSVGATAQPPISTSQPYSNKTFGGGVKSAVGTGTSTAMALVEDSLGEGGTSGGNRGETPCSGLANWCVQLAAEENGINPSDLVLFASAPGQGGTRIDELYKGTTYYTRLLGHVTDAKALATAAGAGYAVPMVAWVQGESDCDLPTTRANYKARLKQLAIDLNADIKEITGQTEDVCLVIYQTAYKVVTTNGDIAQAQMDAVAESDLISFGTPIYHVAYATDSLHITNVSELRLGRAFGRAAKQIIVDGREPDCIMYVSATARGTSLTIQFKSPTPLKIDADALPATTDFGFKVIDDTGTLTLANITASGWTVSMTLNRTLGANPKVRYARDYLGAGMSITGGASGNLRDTTPGTFRVSGTTFPAWHVAPAFELAIINLDATS